MRGEPRPPRLAAWLLERLVPPPAREGVLGDLEEDHARCAAAHGSVRAGLRYWREAAGFWWNRPSRRPAFAGAARAFAADLRFAARSLRGSPGFTLAAVGTLALGIGAGTAIFSVAYGVSLRPLPFPHPERLVRLYEAHPAEALIKQDVSIGAFDDWRTGAPALESAALYSKIATRFLTDTARTPIAFMRVSPAFFTVLGVAPLLGRDFAQERDYTPVTADKEVMLSYAAWQRVFGGRADVLGQSVTVGGVGDEDRYRVIGVMPATFEFDQPVDAWRPTMLVEHPIGRLLRMWRYDRVVARLRPGATIDQARAQLDAIAAREGRDYPAIHGGWTVTVESLHAAIAGTFARATWLLLVAVALVLLVSSVNVGGLLLARAVHRQRDTAIRAAIGAGTWRLVSLRVAESLWLAGLGATGGVLLAWWALALLKAAAPPGIPRLDAIALDRPALLVALASTLAAIVLFTLAPLGRPGRDLVARLRSGGSAASAGPERTRVRVVLTALQCAAAAALVMLTVLLVRSYARLTSFDPGWSPAGVVAMNVAPPMPPELRRPWYRYIQWSDQVIARLQATPGIRRAAVTTQIPLSADSYGATVARGRGRAAGEDARWPAVRHNVTDGYFALLGIRLIDGRTFDDRDRFSEAAANYLDKGSENGTAVVSRSTAQRLWPGQSALGQPLWLPDIDNVAWRQVVGVVDDVHFGALAGPDELHVFVPWTQMSTGAPRLVVQGTGEARDLLPAVRAVVQSVARGTAIDHEVALDALVSRATAQPRFTTRTVAAFGGLALLLAAVGLYGMLSYTVAASTREFGIRIALGAPAAGILSRVFSLGLVPAALGGIGGLAAAAAIARAFRALLFRTDPLDARSLLAAGVLVVAVAALAAAGPALRASRIDPIRALRAD